MNEEKAKEAFKKVKEDIDFLYQDLSEIKSILKEIRFRIQQTNKQTFQQAQQTPQPTNQHITLTEKDYSTNIPTHIPTHNLPLEEPKRHNSNVSTGNEGVPTNQPTNQQTNQHPLISTDKFALIQENSITPTHIPTHKDKITHLQRVSEILNSLDALKKEVRIKFKKLTNQEMAIYSIIYQLEEQGILTDYSILAEKSNLSEISIRDYIRKIINKGIPLDKIKENNKKIVLKIPQNLKKIASLSTILQLREL